MKKLSIAFILVVVVIHILAQLTEFHLKQIIHSVGLYNDMITRIYQDSKRFMWFGSSEGSSVMKIPIYMFSGIPVILLPFWSHNFKYFL